MITPLDIQNKTFKTEFKGYCKSEVDEFLNLIIQSYEKIYRESIEFREQIAFLERTVENYKALENTLKDTLVVAQQTSEHVKIQANEEARVIINEAKMTARKIINDAHEEVKKISFKYEELKRSIGVYQARMISLLNSQLDLLNNTATSEKTLVELLGVNEALEEIEQFEKANEINNENAENINIEEYNESDGSAAAADDNDERAVDVLLSALSADRQEDDTEE